MSLILLAIILAYWDSDIPMVACAAALFGYAGCWIAAVWPVVFS